MACKVGNLCSECDGFVWKLIPVDNKFERIPSNQTCPGKLI